MKMLLPSWLYEALWEMARENNKDIKSYIVDVLVAHVKGRNA